MDRRQHHDSESESDWDTTEDFNSPRHESQAQSWKQHLPPPVAQDSAKNSAQDSARLSTARSSDDRNVYSEIGHVGQEGSSQGQLGGNVAPSPRPRGFKLPGMDGPSAGNNVDARDDRSLRQVSRSSKVKKARTVGQDQNLKKKKSKGLDSSLTNLIPDVGEWGDSENEERTLREVRETMKKEKTKEMVRQQAEANARLAQQSAGREFRQDPNRDIYAVSSRHHMYEKQTTPLPPSRDDVLTPGLVFLDSPQNMTQNALIHQDQLVYHDSENNKCRYFFQKNNPSFYEIEEPDQEAVTPKIADKVEKVLQRSWREVFGALRIVTAFFVIFAVEATHFLTRYVVQPLFLGVAMVIGDRLVKPLLATLYNFLLQPALLLLYNMLLTTQQVLSPVLNVSREVAHQAAIILGSIRLVVVNSSPSATTPPPRPLAITSHSSQVV